MIVDPKPLWAVPGGPYAALGYRRRELVGPPETPWIMYVRPVESTAILQGLSKSSGLRVALVVGSCVGWVAHAWGRYRSTCGYSKSGWVANTSPDGFRLTPHSFSPPMEVLLNGPTSVPEGRNTAIPRKEFEPT